MHLPSLPGQPVVLQKGSADSWALHSACGGPRQLLQGNEEGNCAFELEHPNEVKFGNSRDQQQSPLGPT